MFNWVFVKGGGEDGIGRWRRDLGGHDFAAHVVIFSETIISPGIHSFHSFDIKI